VAGATAQSAAIGTAVGTPPSVRVVDGSGAPVPGVSVAFAVTAGGGTVTPGTAVTNASGIATTTAWTLGTTLGANTMQASVGSLTPVTFTATAVAGPAAQLVKSSTDPQNATVGTAVAAPPSVLVKDAAGNPLAGVTVVFAVASGGGALTGATAVSSASGLATVGSWTLGTTSGTNTVTASVSGVTPVTFTATGVASAPATLTVTPASTALGVSASQPITAVVKDQYGNVVANAPISYTSGNTGVAQVTTAGVVSGVAFGSTAVTVTSGTFTKQVLVRVGTHPAGTSRVDAAETGQPYGLRISSQEVLLVAERANARVGRYNLPSTTIAGTIGVGAGPLDVDFSPNGQTAYVVDSASSALSILNVGTNTVTATVPITGTPLRVLTSTDGVYVYVTTASGKVVRVTTSNLALDEITPTGTLGGIALHPTQPLLYVSAREGGVYEIDFPSGHVVRPIPTGGVPHGIALSPDGTMLYVTDQNGPLQVRSLATLALTTTVTAASGGFGVAVSPDGAQLYVTRPASGETVVLDRTTLAVVRTIAGTTPRRVVFNQSGTTAAIADEANVVTIVK
jgi:YVTN family beta-propeller protein